MVLRHISDGKAVKPIMNPSASDRNDTDMHTGATERRTSESTSRSTEALSNSTKHSPDSFVLALLHEQRKDIDRILTNVEHLQIEMQSMTKTLDDLKARPVPDLDAAKEFTVFTKEFDVLTKLVTRHSTKLNSVDGLQLELEMMRHRIKRIEQASSRAAAISPKTGQFARMTGSLARRPVPKEQPRLVGEVVDVEGETVIEGTPDARERDGTDSPSLESTGHDHPHASPKVAARDIRIELAATAGTEATINNLAGAANTDPDNVPIEDLGPGEPSNGVTPLQTLQDIDSVMDDVTMVPQTQADSSYHPSTTQSTLQSVSVDSTYSTAIDELDDLDFTLEGRATTSPRSRGALRGRHRGRGVRRSLPSRLPTPEWEKPDWASIPVGAWTYPSPPSRGQVVRRGGNGHVSITDSRNKRQKTGSVLSSGSVIDGRLRDEEGFLLKPNGERDGRSVKMKMDNPQARKYDK